MGYLTIWACLLVPLEVVLRELVERAAKEVAGSSIAPLRRSSGGSHASWDPLDGAGDAVEGGAKIVGDGVACKIERHEANQDYFWGVEGEGGEGEVDEGEDSGVGGDGEGDCYLRFTWWKARTEEAHMVERANRGGRTEEAHTVERANRGGTHGGERRWMRCTRWRGRTEEAHTVVRANRGGAHGGEGEQRRQTRWRAQMEEAHTVEIANGGGAHRR
ncbi:hypothetical protein Scep_024883 [Stephania cephalantha]|uniref:Uncharacterized protein n=1 Tax=Stephania cephalantha TaxID=152367 RepID=A0AAP0F4N2_9MAGN